MVFFHGKIDAENFCKIRQVPNTENFRREIDGEKFSPLLCWKKIALVHDQIVFSEPKVRDLAFILSVLLDDMDEKIVYK